MFDAMIVKNDCVDWIRVFLKHYTYRSDRTVACGMIGNAFAPPYQLRMINTRLIWKSLQFPHFTHKMFA